MWTINATFENFKIIKVNQYYNFIIKIRKQLSSDNFDVSINDDLCFVPVCTMLSFSFK